MMECCPLPEQQRSEQRPHEGVRGDVYKATENVTLIWTGT